MANQIKKIQFLVLDEADRMLQAGHFKNLDDIMTVLDSAPSKSPLDHSINQEEIDDSSPKKSKRQTFIFSATMVDDSSVQQNLTKKQKFNKTKSSGKSSQSSVLFKTLIKKITFHDPKPMYVNLADNGGLHMAQGIQHAKITCLTPHVPRYSTRQNNLSFK